MVEQITEKRMVEEDVSVGLDITCDCCGKKILHRIGDRPESGGCAEYWHFHGGHNDWGNDSIDSMEHYDACSDECLSKIISKFMEDTKNNTRKFFEVEQEYDR